MHLLESYSLSCGQKIDKMFILESFIPVPFNKYIVFAPYSRPSKNYDLWADVLEYILPVLERHGIKIVQIGNKDGKDFMGCYSIREKTSIRQSAYLISNSLLYFGADSFGAHLAGHYDTPRVILYSNNYARNVWPFFGNKSKQSIIEPPRAINEKPSFALEELPKTINRIKPEKIVSEICRLLNLAFDFQFTTERIGDFYYSTLIESVPNHVVDISSLPFSIQNLIVRIDYDFNEALLGQQLVRNKCSIITNKPINQNLIVQLKNNITEIIFVVENSDYIDFIKFVKDIGIRCVLISYLDADRLDALKIDYINCDLIHRQSGYKPNNLEGLFYKSNKLILSNGKIYPCNAAREANLPMDSFNPQILPIIDNNRFWIESEHFMLLRKNQ